MKLGILKFSSSSNKATTTFLQGQFTCDITVMKENIPCFGAYCNRKGRVLAAFQLYRDGDDNYYAYLPHATLIEMQKTMAAYARLAKVTLTDVTNEWGNTLNAIEKISDINAWRLDNIKTHVAYIYPETIGQFTPHQLDYPQRGVVSFTKGCYLGQEIIARTEYLGKRKYTLYNATLSGSASPPKPGDAITDTDGNKVGAVVDIACDKTSPSPYYRLLVSLLIKAATDKTDKLIGMEGLAGSEASPVKLALTPSLRLFYQSQLFSPI